VAIAHVQMPLLLAADTKHFEVSILVLGCVLILGALASGIARRSVLSLTSLFVLIGFVLGPGVTSALHFDARSPFVGDLAIVALIVILFRDGLEVDGEMLQEHWHLPLRKLILAMPLTAGIVALAARLLTDLTWTECFLLGALLSPTDPVLSSGVVTNPRVPQTVRHSLNLESGLNDALALPAVLALAAALTINGKHFVWWRFVLQDVTIGLAVGLLVGLLAARLMPRGKGLEKGIPPHQRSLYALGTAFAAYGLAVLPPRGNGLIAVFVTAITLGIRRPDIRGYFERQGRGHRGDPEARDLPRIRLAAHRARAVHRRLGGRGDRCGHAAPGTPGGGVRRTRGYRDRHGDARIHGLVRAQGGRNDDVRPAGPQRADSRGHADLQPRGAGGLLLDLRARVDRHAWGRLDRAPLRGGATRYCLAVPAAGGIHDPAEQNREQHERDESADQGPEHWC
jgi:sodium/hydrogen exchanger family protein